MKILILMAALSVSLHAQVPPATCTREALSAMAANYFKAVEAHSMSVLPTTANVRITENAAEIKPGEGFIKTGGQLQFQRTIIDTQNCGTLTQAVATEGSGQAVLAVRLRVAAGKVSEIETIIARKGDLAFKPEGLIESKDQDWTTLLPVEARRSREQMNAVADGYYLMFQDHQLAPPFATPCRRWENGNHNPTQVECGWKGAVTQQPARRYPVTDPELGVSAGMNNFSGNWLDVHMFKFDKDGKIAIIQAVDGPVTKGTGWESEK
jgi:hypothetical protein